MHSGSSSVFGTLRVRRLRTTQPVTPFATEISSAMISSTQSPMANTGFSETPPSSISYSERSSNGTSIARWCAMRPSVPWRESAERMPAAASTSASSAESPAFAEDGMTDTCGRSAGAQDA